jgi:hypothetical protein
VNNHYRVTFTTGNTALNDIELTRVIIAKDDETARKEFAHIFGSMYPRHTVTKVEQIEWKRL